jgi:hypothetical protein
VIWKNSSGLAGSIGDRKYLTNSYYFPRNVVNSTRSRVNHSNSCTFFLLQHLCPRLFARYVQGCMLVSVSVCVCRSMLFHRLLRFVQNASVHLHQFTFFGHFPPHMTQTTRSCAQMNCTRFRAHPISLSMLLLSLQSFA